MPTIFKSDLHKYIDKNDVRMLRKCQGKAIYLPDHLGAGYMSKYGDVEIDGDGFMDTISNFFKPANSFVGFMKDNKSSIGDVLGLAAKAAKPIISTAVGVEQIKALREQRKMMEEQRKQMNENNSQQGSAIYLPKTTDGDGLISLRTPTTKSTRDTEVINRIVKGNGFKILN